MTFKKLIGKLHLWLGLASGLVVTISLVAASVFVWEDELFRTIHADLVYVEAKSVPMRPLSELKAVAQRAVGAAKPVKYASVSSARDRAVVFTAQKRHKKYTGWTYYDEVDYWQEVYVNPYDGRVLSVFDKKYDPIFSARMLHQTLLLRRDVGHYVVGYATLVFIVMLLTGLVLWWPRSRAARKQRFSVKWTAKWRRVNYDLHNVGGFYALLVALLLAVTGLVWTFNWWTNGIYRILGQDPETAFHEPAPPRLAQTTDPALDRAFSQARSKHADFEEISFSMPAPDDSVKSYDAYVNLPNRSGWNDSDTYQFDADGKEYFRRTHADKTLGEKWRNSNYDIHVGSIYGLPTKLLAFFVTLFCASLPVSGFLIWWGRRRKKAAPKRGKTNLTTPAYRSKSVRFGERVGKTQSFRVD